MCLDETLGDGTLWRCCWERHHQPVSLWSSVVRCTCTCVLDVTKVWGALATGSQVCAPGAAGVIQVWGGLATGSQVCLPHATVVTLVCILGGWPEAHRCPPRHCCDQNGVYGVTTGSQVSPLKCCSGHIGAGG